MAPSDNTPKPILTLGFGDRTNRLITLARSEERRGNTPSLAFFRDETGQIAGVHLEVVR